MAEFETTTLTGSGLPAGVTPLLYRSAAGRLVAAAGLCFVTGAADARTFLEAPGDLANGLDVDVTRVPADPFGANADGAAVAGAAGSIQAKLRLMTTQLAAMAASLDTLDNVVTSNRVQVDIVSGGLTITRPATWTITTPSMSTAESLLIASNNNRLGLFVRNRSDVPLYLVGGVTAATLLNTPIIIDAGATWRDESGYTGPYRAILDTGGTTANCPVGELTA